MIVQSGAEAIAVDLGRPVGSAEGGPAVADSRESWFRSVLDALPAAVYVTDAAGRITYYNEAATALWGQSPDQDSAKWCGSWRLYRPDGTRLSHDECPMAVCLREGRPVREVEVVAERPDGTRVPFLPYPTPLRDASGAVVGAVNMLLDIGAQKTIEKAGAYLAAIVESSDDAIVGKTLNGVVTSWNRGAELLFGYCPAEMIGRPITVLLPPDRLGEESLILDRIRRGERVASYETVRRCKDGREIDISLTVSPATSARASAPRRRCATARSATAAWPKRSPRWSG
jgi:PAS domain S-box-containing protein